MIFYIPWYSAIITIFNEYINNSNFSSIISVTEIQKINLLFYILIYLIDSLQL